MKEPRTDYFDPSHTPEEAPKLGSPMDHLPTIARPGQQPRSAATPQRRNSATPQSAASTPQPSPTLGDGFDINLPHEAKGSFMLTEAEYDALAELKRPLSRQFGTQISLHDLARCAVNLLIEDYRANSDQSFLVRHLQRKHPK